MCTPWLDNPCRWVAACWLTGLTITKSVCGHLQLLLASKPIVQLKGNQAHMLVDVTNFVYAHLQLLLFPSQLCSVECSQAHTQVEGRGLQDAEE